MTELPRLVRPLETEYIVIGKVLAENDFYSLNFHQFLGIVMKESRGFMNPYRVAQIYQQLREEAGMTTKIAVANSILSNEKWFTDEA
mgnify:FL=1